MLEIEKKLVTEEQLAQARLEASQGCLAGTRDGEHVRFYEFGRDARVRDILTRLSTIVAEEYETVTAVFLQGMSVSIVGQRREVREA